MANAQGGQGRPEGQGGHGQTFTSRQHDKALYRESEGPGVEHAPDGEGGEVYQGAESTIDVPEDDDPGAAMEPQVDQATGQGIVGGS